MYQLQSRNDLEHKILSRNSSSYIHQVLDKRGRFQTDFGPDCVILITLNEPVIVYADK